MTASIEQNKNMSTRQWPAEVPSYEDEFADLQAGHLKVVKAKDLTFERVVKGDGEHNARRQKMNKFGPVTIGLFWLLVLIGAGVPLVVICLVN
jgi:hypothetical protein